MKFVRGKKLASARRNRTGRKQRQKEIIGELCRQAEDVVFARFFCGALEQFAPAERDLEGSEHEVIPCKIMPDALTFSLASKGTAPIAARCQR